MVTYAVASLINRFRVGSPFGNALINLNNLPLLSASNAVSILLYTSIKYMQRSPPDPAEPFEALADPSEAPVAASIEVSSEVP